MVRTPEMFAREFLALAQKTEKQFGVPALLTLAQAALESGWGGNTPGNMFFGIKASAGWMGKTQKLLTSEFVNGEWEKVYAYFRAYPGAAESFNDHGRFLKDNGRYAKVFDAPTEAVMAAVEEKEKAAGVPQEWLADVAKADIAAYWVAEAGYATAPHYYEILQTLIRKFSMILGGVPHGVPDDHPCAVAARNAAVAPVEQKETQPQTVPAAPTSQEGATQAPSDN